MLTTVRDAQGSVVDFRFEDMNAAARRELGVAQGPPFGQELSALGDRAAGLLAVCRAALGSDGPVKERLAGLELQVEREADGVVAFWCHDGDAQAAHFVREGPGFQSTGRVDSAGPHGAPDSVARKLAESEERLWLAVEATGLGVYDYDVSTGLATWSERLRALFDAPAAGPIAPESVMRARIHPEDRARFFEAVDRAMDPAGVGSHALEFRIVRSDGTTRWLRNLGRVIFGVDEAGDRCPVRSVGAVLDITDRKQVEHALWSNEERLRLALEAATAGTFDFDVTRRGPPVVTDGLKRLFGFDPAESPGVEEYLERVHPADREHVRTAFVQAVETATGHDIEYRIAPPGCAPRWVSSRASVRCAPSGALARLLGVVVDISERRASEEAIRASERQYRQLAESMPQLVWTANRAGVVDYYNARARNYAGIHQREDGTWSWEPVLHPEDLEATVVAWQNALATGTDYACEHRVRMADGSFRWHLSRAHLVRAEDGSPERWFGTATDIEEQKAAEVQLRLAVASRDQIVSVVSHDLRNPLNVLRLTHSVLKGALGADADIPRHRIEDSLQRMGRQVAKMEKLLNELLDIGALQAGQILRLELGRRDIVALARGVVDDHARAAPRHRLELRSSVESLWGLWDIDRIEQVLGNLLSNAVKYSPPESQVLVVVEEEMGHAIVRVVDHGMGIAEADLHRVFEWYGRGANAANSVRGTGIGLAGARRIVEQHGGELTVQSVVGRGSTFTLRLPLAPFDATDTLAAKS